MTWQRRAYIVAAVVTLVAAALALVWIHAGRHWLALVPIVVVAGCAEIMRRTADALAPTRPDTPGSERHR